jgi:hypothetical protein
MRYTYVPNLEGAREVSSVNEATALALGIPETL